MVIPRSFSKSISSKVCDCNSLWVTVLVYSKSRSASVDFPWSICAMMQKFLMFFIQFLIVCKFSVFLLDFSVEFLRCVVAIGIATETPQLRWESLGTRSCSVEPDPSGGILRWRGNRPNDKRALQNAAKLA